MPYNEVPLAIGLAYERKMGTASVFYPYISLLPEKSPCLVFKSKAEIDSTIKALGALFLPCSKPPWLVAVLQTLSWLDALRL